MSTEVLNAAAHDLAVGDTVLIHRNLDHPAWCQPIYGSPRDTGITWVRQDDIPELMGSGVVSAVRDRQSYQSAGGALESQIRREICVDGFWYDAETLDQLGPKSTFIRPVLIETESDDVNEDTVPAAGWADIASDDNSSIARYLILESEHAETVPAAAPERAA